MPFDFGPQPIDPRRSRQAVILDNIIDYLDDRSHWTRLKMRRGNALCLVGAIKEFTPFFQRREIYDRVIAALPGDAVSVSWGQRFRRGVLVLYNDNATHASVMQTLRRARGMTVGTTPFAS